MPSQILQLTAATAEQWALFATCEPDTPEQLWFWPMRVVAWALVERWECDDDDTEEPDSRYRSIIGVVAADAPWGLTVEEMEDEYGVFLSYLMREQDFSIAAAKFHEKAGSRLRVWAARQRQRRAAVAQAQAALAQERE